MDIGIATFQWADNYGAVLQAWALQHALSKRGHRVEIIDYRLPDPPLLRRWLSATPAGCIRKWQEQWKRRTFESFRRRRLIRTPESYRSVAELARLADRYDMLITGSDQVWNPCWLNQVAGLYEFYTLSFAGARTRRVAYAASYGHAELESMPPEGRAILADALKAFDAISVREASGVEMTADLCGRTDAVHMPDPTVLLDTAEYREFLGNSAYPEPPGLYVYMLHNGEREVAPWVHALSDDYQWPVRWCNLKDTGLRRGREMPAPEKWLQRIRDAAFVVTNSYHCVLFCLQFHTPFAAVPVTGPLAPMNARVLELLDRCGLRDRWVDGSGTLSAARNFDSINWEEADRMRAALRQTAFNYMTALGV